MQKSRNWGERASKGFGFTLTNMKRKSSDSSAEAVAFSLNFRCLAEPAEQVSHMGLLHNRPLPSGRVAACLYPCAVVAMLGCLDGDKVLRQAEYSGK